MFTFVVWVQQNMKMTRKRGYFRSEKQLKRRENVSAAQVRRWAQNNLAEEHCYSSTSSSSAPQPTVPLDFPDLSFVGKDVWVGDNDDWRDGRRIVELSVLADGLSGCKMCNNPLSLSHTTRVLNYGLGALLKIPCKNTACQHTNTVPTGKRHQQVFDMNTKLATGKKCPIIMSLVGL